MTATRRETAPFWGTTSIFTNIEPVAAQQCERRAAPGLHDRRPHFGIDYLIWQLSQYLAFEPGDLLLTGMPGGVALSGRFPHLSDGDELELDAHAPHVYADELPCGIQQQDIGDLPDLDGPPVSEANHSIRIRGCHRKRRRRIDRSVG